MCTKTENEFSNACWDLDYIEKQHDGNWTLMVDQDETAIEKCLDAYKTGTVVVVENLDRLIDTSSMNKSKTSFYKTMLARAIAFQIAKILGTNNTKGD